MKTTPALCSVLALVMTHPIRSGENKKTALQPIPVTEESALSRDIIEKDRLVELINPDFDLWYQGTWSEWHLFSFRGGFTYGNWTSLDPMYRGVFRCSNEDVKIDKNRIIDLEGIGHISNFTVQKIVEFDEVTCTVLTELSLFEESGIKLQPEPDTSLKTDKPASPELGLEIE